MKATVRFRIQFLFALFVCGSTCLAQVRQPASKKPAQNQPGAPFLQQVKAYEESPYVTKIVLKNGMTVLVNEFRIQPVVSMQLYVRAGFVDEPPQTPGLAALVRAVVQRGMPDKTGGTYR